MRASLLAVKGLDETANRRNEGNLRGPNVTATGGNEGLQLPRFDLPLGAP